MEDDDDDNTTNNATTSVTTIDESRLTLNRDEVFWDTHELSETRAYVNGFGKVLIPTKWTKFDDYYCEI